MPFNVGKPRGGDGVSGTRVQSRLTPEIAHEGSKGDTKKEKLKSGGRRINLTAIKAALKVRRR